MNKKNTSLNINKKIIHMKDLNLNNKIVLIRVDFNVPIKNNKILCDNRIKASLPTISFALKKNAKVQNFCVKFV